MLPELSFEGLVRQALAEDLGSAGDLTTGAIVPAGHISSFVVRARQEGVVSGTAAAALTFRLLDADTRYEARRRDGARVSAGEVIGVVRGPTQALLSGERVALNFLGHLSGVATATAVIADAIAHTPTRVTCTRKTTPGLRALEKAAVAAGGGVNHRFGLYDAVLIKDNHIAIAGGVTEAIARAWSHAGHLVSIEVEVDSLAQLEAILTDDDAQHAVRAVLLDNMSREDTRAAVGMVAAAATPGGILVEASGRITAGSALEYALAGVDLVSAGWITHSAPVLDIGLDAE